MTIKKITLLLATASAVLYSCSKNDPNPNDEDNSDALKGTYDFVGMKVATTSTTATTNTDSAFTNKTVVISHYNTRSNEGTVVIDGSSFNLTGFAYRIDTMVRVMIYKRDVLDSDTEVPFTATVPKINNNAPYRLTGTDSIYYEKGFIDSPDGTGPGQDSEPNGYKFSWSGDTLILKGAVATREKVTQPGSSSYTEYIVEASQTVKLKKRK